MLKEIVDILISLLHCLCANLLCIECFLMDLLFGESLAFNFQLYNLVKLIFLQKGIGAILIKCAANYNQKSMLNEIGFN